ncbi:MAG: metallophosphoesterase [Ruminococcaceae bacterium]|nr:metallophosphoesterase [Oscillospiraceae bacterium]
MSILKTKPAVFAVGDVYQIMVQAKAETLMWIKCGNNCYYDESNGILRSHCQTHKICVPMKELDCAGEYEVCYREVIERKAYFTESKEENTEKFKFFPVAPNQKQILAYQIADAHNLVDEPVAAVKRFEKEYGKIDFLILNGDIPDHSGAIENFDTIYQIACKITGGEIPIVFARGNHDLRGVFAENLAEHTPNENGNSYFTTRLGNIWALILDCGEDKDDDNSEYAHTVSCTPFRQKQTEYIKSLTKYSQNQYKASGIDYRLVISHIPFTQSFRDPFNIENEIYDEWTQLLNDEVKPHLMLSAHMHEFKIHNSDSQNNRYNHSFTVAVGPEVHLGKNPYYAGIGLQFKDGKIEIILNDQKEIISTFCAE